MITALTVSSCPPHVRDTFEALAHRWPVGATVGHSSGWIGQIAVDDPGNPLTITGGVGAHCLLSVGGRKLNAAVCVTWQVDGHPATAWFRPNVLHLVRPDRAHRTRGGRRGRRTVS